MKSVIFLAALLCIVVVRAEDILKEEDMDQIQDEKWFLEFYTCLMDQGPCSDKMAVYKDAIPKYIDTKCGSCSPNEKDLFEKLCNKVAEKYPKEFKELMDKFTPKAQ